MRKNPRTFKVEKPHMRGDDVTLFQRDLKARFKKLGWDYPLKVDGDYGVATRSAAATVVRALGIAHSAMKDGVTPELRSKIRNHDLTPAEKKRRDSPKVKAWRAEMKKRYSPARVAAPVSTVIADSWGWTPPVHDGLDIICPPRAPIFAMVKSRVIRTDADGWWGKAPSGNVKLGDGIIVLEVLENVGPFKKGMHVCYGHAEESVVTLGSVVEAGEMIGRAGLAVAWHIHLMINDDPGNRGVGDRDPRPFYDYARKHAA